MKDAHNDLQMRLKIAKNHLEDEEPVMAYKYISDLYDDVRNDAFEVEWAVEEHER